MKMLLDKARKGSKTRKKLKMLYDKAGIKKQNRKKSENAPCLRQKKKAN